MAASAKTAHHLEARAEFAESTQAKQQAGMGAAVEFNGYRGGGIEDRASFVRLSRVLAASAGVSLLLQTIYLEMDWHWGKSRGAAILSLHLLNLLTSLIFLGLTFRPNFRERVNQYVLGGCVLIFAATTALAIVTLNSASLTITVSVTLIAAAALVPWNWRWQASLTLAGACSIAALTLLWPIAGRRTGNDWLALIAAAFTGQCVGLSGERQRREITSRITALQLKHRELLAETARREAAAAANERVRRQLGESETKLRKIFETSSDLITINRLTDGRYLEVNEAFVLALGYTREEVLGASAGALGIWQDQGRLREFLKTLAAQGAVINMDLNACARDGHIEPLLLSAKILELAGEKCVVSTARNIRTIKEAEADLIAAREMMRAQIEALEQAEERLRTEIHERELAVEQRETAVAANALAIKRLGESEAKLRKIFETSSDVIMINRLSDGRYLDVNEAFETAYGYSREEALAATARTLGVWAVRDRLRDFTKTIAAQGAVVNTEMEARTKNGRLEPFLISSNVIELDGEKCVVTIARAIRSLKQAEADLIAARESALAASRAKSEFLSSMSHEIRTPLNAILGMGQLLHETALDADQRKYLEIMSRNGDALLELINGILDLAKIESGRLALEQAGFELETLVDRTVETLSVRAHQKGLELLAHVMPDVPTQLVGDRLRVGQILFNLIGNAIKFTDKGQVLLTVERDPASGVPGHLHFSVADTGIGIAGDKLEEVFANFTQADSSTSRQYGGSGLGLAIVRRLAALMDGRVWVESELGHGSVFHFTAHFQVQADALAERTPAVLLSGLRALVVDDNDTNRLILREMLASRGAEVDEAENGPAALEHIERAKISGLPYKLILLDCRMPGMDGFQVAERVRAGAEQGLTVLMLTSDDFSVQQTHAHEIGLDACLVKPVRRAELFEAISAAIASRAADAGAGIMQTPRAAALAAQASAPTALEPAPAAESSAADAPPAPGLKILLTDDSDDNRMLIHAFLKNTCHRVDDAENGAVAVAKLKAGNYDLVLMDIQMPVMDGLEATGIIRDWERKRGLPRTPLIALTASALDEDVRRTLEAGADLHLSKPIGKAALLAAIGALQPSVIPRHHRNPSDAAA